MIETHQYLLNMMILYRKKGVLDVSKNQIINRKETLFMKKNNVSVIDKLLQFATSTSKKSSKKEDSAKNNSSNNSSNDDLPALSLNLSHKVVPTEEADSKNKPKIIEEVKPDSPTLQSLDELINQAKADYQAICEEDVKKRKNIEKQRIQSQDHHDLEL